MVGSDISELRSEPARALADPRQRDQHDADAGRHQRGPPPVDARIARRGGGGCEHASHQPERDQREREIDPEDRAPRQVLGEESAEQRRSECGRGEHAREIALVAAALRPWRQAFRRNR
jgi:hypothetical protein